MSTPRGTFAAVPTNAHASPPLALMRLQRSPESDVYFYRAILFCKEYEQSGCLDGKWAALASYAHWPDDPDALRELFVQAGAVLGPRAELWQWDRYNGYLIRKSREDADRHRKKRQAGKASAKARRAKARAKQLSLLPRAKPKRLQMRLPIPRSRGNKRPSSKETPER